MEDLKVPRFSVGELLNKAFENYEWHGGEKRLEDVSYHDMNHILLNYIRHNLVPQYDSTIIEDQWQYFSWFSKTNRAIAKTYPFLRTTAEQQIRRKELKLSTKKYERDGWESL